MVMVSYAFGAVYTVIPDFGEHLGIHNKGVLFACLTVASLMIRMIAGKASDIYGRVPVLKVSTLMIVISMVAIATADRPWWLMAGVILYGRAQGSTSSTLLAWATDLSDEHYRGRGLASLYISMEFGIGAGALGSGWLYGNEHTQFFQVFAVCSGWSAIACAYLFLRPYLQHV
jgi:MFS family permease